MPDSTPAPVYLDHAATSPVRDEVLEAMLPFFGPRFGNPSSTHRWGREARVALDEARERVAGTLGARADEICFTSCGTEGDNMAVLGVWHARRLGGRNAVVASAIEHKAVLGAIHCAAREGAVERLVSANSDGVVDLDAAAESIRDDVAVCSVMWVNNETGVVQPMEGIAEVAKSAGAVFHTDAVQAFGKVDVNASRQPYDLLTVSGHKIGAPKGIGALFIRRGTKLEPLMHGGSQDRGRRPGTENVAFAVGLARAMELASSEREGESTRLRALRDALEAAILQRLPDAVIHGRAVERAAHVSNVSVPGAESEALLMGLDLQGIAASGGSACQSGSIGASHVLEAMGVAPEVARCAVRFSLGPLSTPDLVERTATALAAVAARARAVAGVMA
ncbi:MAG TPA: cysteine desulfurase family protein [Gemmatimonadaceae bacterium]